MSYIDLAVFKDGKPTAVYNSDPITLVEAVKSSIGMLESTGRILTQRERDLVEAGVYAGGLVVTHAINNVANSAKVITKLNDFAKEINEYIET